LRRIAEIGGKIVGSPKTAGIQLSFSIANTCDCYRPATTPHQPLLYTAKTEWKSGHCLLPAFAFKLSDMGNGDLDESTKLQIQLREKVRQIFRSPGWSLHQLCIFDRKPCDYVSMSTLIRTRLRSHLIRTTAKPNILPLVNSLKRRFGC
jgi:hypothetical protein